MQRKIRIHAGAYTYLQPQPITSSPMWSGSDSFDNGFEILEGSIVGTKPAAKPGQPGVMLRNSSFLLSALEITGKYELTYAAVGRPLFALGPAQAGVAKPLSSYAVFSESW